MAIVLCKRCGRVVPPDDHVAFEGFAYHNTCLPKRALEGEKGSQKKGEHKPFVQRFWDELEAVATDGKIPNLDQALVAIAIKLNVNRGYLEYLLRELDMIGSVYRIYNSLELRERPTVESSG